MARLRACGELDLDDAAASRLCAMSAATIDRRLAGERKRLELKGRSGTKPGSLLKSQIPIRTEVGVPDDLGAHLGGRDASAEGEVGIAGDEDVLQAGFDDVDDEAGGPAWAM